ncbi:MAG TPA: ABC transporter ATP-binding protein [Bacteroidales bacterium]|jgi:ABC-2 type transport system ATP-binding protein|nr:ABC transporter ATP-binding protein [Bacteroidales bacterium]
MKNPPVIQIENLTKWYKGNSRAAINNVSLDVPEGRIFGLLGPNGAGKTTMIRILCGLLAPTSGNITIGGYSLKHAQPAIKKIIGVVPQEIALYPTLTAWENLLIYGGICGLKGADLKSRINNLLKIFGLEKSRNQQVRKYSGGMKRRLNLIAGIIHNPKILFLDEPTVGVDVHSKNVIIENLFEINRKGTTIVYTSHYLEEAENLCSYLAIIDEGIIITRGTLNEISKEHNAGSKLEDIFLQLTGRELRD